MVSPKKLINVIYVHTTILSKLRFNAQCNPVVISYSFFLLVY